MRGELSDAYESTLKGSHNKAKIDKGWSFLGRAMDWNKNRLSASFDWNS
jgi:hypothetical protein